jgi:ADP-ribose pyrophosphatase YjhB (NUDIX family)
MAYCIRCGQTLIRRWVPQDGREREICSACQAVHYENPKLLVACWVYWTDQILLCRRAVEPAKGLWFLPTGFVEAKETLEEAAIRELAEETGLSLPTSSLILYGVANLPHMNQVYIAYRTELNAEPKFNAGCEVLEVRLFSEAQTQSLQLAFADTTHGILRRFFSRMRNGEFPLLSVTLGREADAPGNSNS